MSERDPRVDPRPGDVLRNSSKRRHIERVGNEFNPHFVSGIEVFNSGYGREFSVLTTAGWWRWAKSAEVIQHYHHASPKHLNRYVQEFAWRLNEGDVKRHTLERLESFIHAVVGKRLTYERLTA